VLEALLYGLVASSSLLVGALIGLRVPIGDRPLGLLMGLGAGAMISSLSFELAEEAIHQGGFVPLALGLATGALLFYGGDRLLEARGHRRRSGRPRGADAGASGATLALGALLDGIPEQAAIGIGLAAAGAGATGGGIALVAAVFLSNVPEALASAAAMKSAGRPAAHVVRLWLLVVLAGTAATVVGWAALGDASGDATAFILAVAAGAVIVMLTDAMIPQAVGKGGKSVGLVTCLGFALAVLIDQL
jgi:ZIP family zinc transporter